MDHVDLKIVISDLTASLTGTIESIGESIMNPQEVGAIVSQLTTPFIVMMVGLIVTMGIKDYATAMTKGLAFKFFGPFKEGDHVILDGDKAVVVKIGASMTVFGLNNKQGYMWRYIPNEKIANAKLGKIIFDASTEDNKELINLNAEQIRHLKDQL
jgi:hypothetical protein